LQTAKAPFESSQRALSGGVTRERRASCRRRPPSGAITRGKVIRAGKVPQFTDRLSNDKPIHAHKTHPRRPRGYKNSSRTGEGEPTLEAVQPLSIDWIRHNGHLTNRVRGGESFFPEGSWSTSVEGFDFSFHHRDGTQSIHFDRTSPKLSQPFKIAPRHGETRDARAPGSTLLTDDPGGLRDPPGP
jgi:hypothetical protein